MEFIIIDRCSQASASGVTVVEIAKQTAFLKKMECVNNEIAMMELKKQRSILDQQRMSNRVETTTPEGDQELRLLSLHLRGSLTDNWIYHSDI